MLDLSKAVMYEFWYDVNQKFCYVDTDSFTVHVKS